MSFGVSVGDVIAVAKLASEIYTRCSRAGDNFSSLAQRVDLLRGCTETTRDYLHDEPPGTSAQLQTISGALPICEATLRDVGKLLQECESLGTKSKRFLDRLKFTMKDIEQLELRLSSSSTYLQSCHTSLLLLSSQRVTKMLFKIEAEYRNDKRPRSVLSVALVGGQDVNEEEVMEQAEKDLMTEDVHPAAIDMYREGIKRWILAPISETGDDDDLRQRPSIITEPVALGPSPEDLDPLHHGIINTGTQQSRTGAGPTAVVPADVDDTWHELPSIANSEAPSRVGSIKSHSSKDSRWHPSAKEDARFVTAMLSKPFMRDPFKQDMSSEQTLFYFTRAFSQLDFSEQGMRRRPDVISACQDAMRATNSGIPVGHCDLYIYTGDTNNDSNIDRAEFLASMTKALEAARALLRNIISSQIRSSLQRADTLAIERQTSKAVLPWGFHYVKNPYGYGKDQYVYDRVEQVSSPDFPPSSTFPSKAPKLALNSFTLLADEISTRSLGILNSSSIRWSRALPKDHRVAFSNVFDKVKSVAIRFSLLHRAGNPNTLSDLDEMLTVLNLVMSATPSEPIRTHLTALRQLQVDGEKIACLVRGFTWRLETLQSENPPHPSPQTLTSDLARWRGAHMDTWAYLIAESIDFKAVWDGITARVEECRKWYTGFNELSLGMPGSPGSPQGLPKLHNKLESQALDIARSFVQNLRDTNARRKLEIEKQPVKFEIADLRVALTVGNAPPERVLSRLFRSSKNVLPKTIARKVVLNVFSNAAASDDASVPTIVSGPHILDHGSRHDRIEFSVPRDTALLSVSIQDANGMLSGAKGSEDLKWDRSFPISKWVHLRFSDGSGFNGVDFRLEQKGIFVPEPEGPSLWVRLTQEDSLLQTAG